MNGMPSTALHERVSIHVITFASILALAIGTGVTVVLYSPFIPLAASLMFTVVAMGLYFSSQLAFVNPRMLVESPEKTTKTSMLFYIMFVGFLLSITIPKSGKTVSGIPITAANLVILLALACWFLTVLIFQKPFAQIPLHKSLITFIIYGIIASLIGFINNNSHKAILLDFVAFIGFIPIYFMVCHLVRNNKQIRLIVIAVIVGLVFVCGYGVLQKRYGFSQVAIPGITEQYGMIQYAEFGGRWNLIEGGGQKLYSTFQNGNIFGHHLAIFLPFLGGLVMGLRNSWKRLLLLALLVGGLYVLFLTYSRGAMVGTISGMLTLLVVSKKIRVQGLIVILIFFVMLFVLVSQYSDRPEFNRYDLQRIKENPDQFSSGRLERAGQALAGFQRLPFTQKLFGIGFGGILITPAYWRLEYVDNLYLTFLFKIGIIGLVLLLWVFGRMFLILFRLRTQTADLRIKGLINGGIAGLAAALIHNLADVLWLFPPLPANFWFLAGISVSIGIINTQVPESRLSS